MEQAMAARYWCHTCSEMVNPILIMEVVMKCPICQSGFVEEMSSSINSNDNQNRMEADFETDRPQALSLWAPILLGMMGNPQLLRRRRNPATILQLLQGMRAELLSYDNSNTNSSESDDRERVILVNPLNQTIMGSVGDYLLRHGLELLLQHLAENDPNSYGSSPAQKEAIEALPCVTIHENLQCCVCLDELEVGSKAKEMPCKHRFHSACILPWLQLHSSCPVCRSQLLVDRESKSHSDMSTNNSSNQRESEEVDGVMAARRFSFPWPFNGFFPSSTSTSSSSSSSSTSNANINNAPESQDN